MMSTVTANQDVIARYCDAWRRGDMATLVDCYGEDFTLHYFGRSPLAGDHVGKPAALATLAKGHAAYRTPARRDSRRAGLRRSRGRSGARAFPARWQVRGSEPRPGVPRE